MEEQGPSQERADDSLQGRDETARPAPFSRDVRIGLLGLGTVGSGVVRLLAENQETIRQRLGIGIGLGSILVRSMGKQRAVQVRDLRLTVNPADVVEDPELAIVVELMGGVSPARELILKAISHGKSVVTANKEVMALHGAEIFRAAEEANVDVAYEASVGGGIPIIRPLKECLMANRLTSLTGILNGTTNYMLTRMSEEGMEFADALREAQELGYAEADPTADIGGHDAARKLAILATLAFGRRVTPKEVYTEGIEGVTAHDVRYADEMGCLVKLLAIAREEAGGLDVRVHPAFIPQASPLAGVREGNNAILVEGEPLGEVMFYGPGAGSGPTASAVVGDIVHIVRNQQRGTRGVYITPRRQLPVHDQSSVRCRYYFRMRLLDRPGTLATVATLMADSNVSLSTVLQKRGGEGADGTWAEVVMVTHTCQEGDILAVRQALEREASVHAVESLIRVL